MKRLRSRLASDVRTRRIGATRGLPAVLVVLLVALGAVAIGAPRAFARAASFLAGGPSPGATGPSPGATAGTGGPTPPAAAPPGSAGPLVLGTPGAGIAWGNNQNGQLGSGKTEALSFTPVPVSLPANIKITDVAAGGIHSLARTSTGAVVAWGDNSSGELGDRSNTNSNTPVQVDLPVNTQITNIAAGGEHSLALTFGGRRVLAWGFNRQGQLGDGTNFNTNTPVPVSLPAGTTITNIAAGGVHSLAVTSTGTVLAWGENDEGQLGNGSRTSSNTPVPVSLPAGTRITAVAAGDSYSLALTSTGAVLAWGTNVQGELGNGTSIPFSVTPVPVSLPAGTTITNIAGGGQHSLARTSTGAVLAWGANGLGQLGGGPGIAVTGSDTPVGVSLPAGTTIAAIAAGRNHSLALTSTGTVLGWGNNGSGELGQTESAGPGTGFRSVTPVPVSLPVGTKITAISAGGRHSLAVGPQISPGKG